jgi:hypothetical protein
MVAELDPSGSSLSPSHTPPLRKRGRRGLGGWGNWSSEEVLSRRLLTQLEIIGPIYPLLYLQYVCNRPLAPILRQRWCSLMYDVY